MIIYLHGLDSYQRLEKLNWYLTKFREKHSALTVENFNLANQEELEKLRSFATAQSLFDNFKFGVLENVGEADAKALQGIFKLSSESKTLTLVISVDKPLSKDYKVPTGGDNKEHKFEESTPADFSKFVREEVQKRELKITESVLATLIKNFNGDRWGFLTELDRIELGGSPEAYAGEQDFFLLATILQGFGPASAKLPALERLLLDNDPAAIFNFVASRAGAELKTKMADYDVAIKSGKTEYPEALFALALGEGSA